jgi:hypothetical protein
MPLFFLVTSYRQYVDDYDRLKRSEEYKENALKTAPAIPPIVSALQDDSGQWIFEKAQWQYTQRRVSANELETEWNVLPGIPQLPVDAPSTDEQSLAQLLQMFQLPLGILSPFNCTEKDNYRIYEISKSAIKFRLMTVMVNNTERIVEGKLALPFGDEQIVIRFVPESFQSVKPEIIPMPDAMQLVCAKTNKIGNICLAFYNGSIETSQLKQHWQQHGFTVEERKVSDTVFDAVCSKENFRVEVNGKITNNRVVTLMLIPSTNL